MCRGYLYPVQAGGDRVTPALKSTNIHWHCSTQKQRPHPSLSQSPWLEAGLGLLKYPTPAWGWKHNSCCWGGEGAICPALPQAGRLSVAHAPGTLLDPAGSPACSVPSPQGTPAPPRLFCHLLWPPRLNCKQCTVRQPESHWGQAGEVPGLGIFSQLPLDCCRATNKNLHCLDVRQCPSVVALFCDLHGW